VNVLYSSAEETPAQAGVSAFSAYVTPLENDFSRNLFGMTILRAKVRRKSKQANDLRPR
jgi:hypothetical protein